MSGEIKAQVSSLWEKLVLPYERDVNYLDSRKATSAKARAVEFIFQTFGADLSTIGWLPDFWALALPRQLARMDGEFLAVCSLAAGISCDSRRYNVSVLELTFDGYVSSPYKKSFFDQYSLSYMMSLSMQMEDIHIYHQMLSP